MAKYNVVLDGVSVVVDCDGDHADAIAAGKKALAIDSTCKQQSAELVSDDAPTDEATPPAPPQEFVSDDADDNEPLQQT